MIPTAHVEVVRAQPNQVYCPSPFCRRREHLPQCAVFRLSLIHICVCYEDRHIKENRPNEEELRAWVERSGLPVKRFFNTSGLVYKSLELKDKLPEMSDDEKIKILATDGMLVKRPLVIGDKGVLVGFKAAEWENCTWL